MPWIPRDGEEFPSLGWELIDWLEAYTCYGPGDVQGQPLELDAEWIKFIVDAYRLDPSSGKRRVDRAILSRSKGRAKSFLAGLLAVAEAIAPTRFDGWDAAGQPVGRPVVSPLIRCLATEETQAGQTFEVAAYIMSAWGPDVHPGIYKNIKGARQYQSATSLYLPNGGDLRACTAGAASKDGGRETFVVADESHLYVLPENKAMYATVARNCGKRGGAEPWLLTTTTAYRPGEQSVAESLITAWKKGELPNADHWLVDHREAKGRVNIQDKSHTMAQLKYVYGAATWMDLERIYRTMLDPMECEDEATAARYFLNRAISGQNSWIPQHVHERQTATREVMPGEAIAVGFDGSLNDDTTVLRGCCMSDGFLFRIGAWPKPTGPAGIGWEVPRSDVLLTIREAYERYDVVRGYFDPHEWRSDIDALAEEFGSDHVTQWATTRDVQMAAALDRLHADLSNRVAFHDADPLAAEHYGNVYVRMRGSNRLVRKEYPNSPRKIDSVVGDTLAYEARADALAAGWTDKPEEKVDRTVFIFR